MTGYIASRPHLSLAAAGVLCRRTPSEGVKAWEGVGARDAGLCHAGCHAGVPSYGITFLYPTGGWWWVCPAPPPSPGRPPLPSPSAGPGRFPGASGVVEDLGCPPWLGLKVGAPQFGVHGPSSALGRV